MKKILALLWLFTVYAVSAQHIDIQEIDASSYPIVRAKYLAYYSNGDIERNLNVGDVEIYESGKKRVVDLTYCTPLSKFSSILTVDISYSMNERIDPDDFGSAKRIEVARNGATIWIDSLPSDRAECAITSFNYETKINMHFTNNKDTLRQAIQDATSNPIHGTNYNAAFLQDQNGQPGALELSKEAQYKPIIVFLTDGEHDSSFFGAVLVDDIIQQANSLNATIYCLTLGMPIPQSLMTISESTGGKYYANLSSEEEVNSAYLDILNEAMDIGTPIPCEISWESDCEGGNGEMVIPKMGNLQQDFSYTVPDSVNPYLEISPRLIKFLNIDINSTEEREITLTARHNSAEITSASVGAAQYIISDWGGSAPPFTLAKDESRTLKLRYTSPADSLYHPCLVTFETSACDSITFFSYAGRIYASNFNVGVSDTNVRKDITLENSICNYSGDKITISKAEISGAQAAEFVLKTPINNVELSNNNCIDADIEFTPKQVGIRTAEITYTTNQGTYTGTLIGIGAGKPDIYSEKSINFGSIGCPGMQSDQTITYMNSGAEDLVISNIRLAGDPEFKFNPQPVKSKTLKLGETDSVKIRFSPQAAGSYQSTLVIESNALSGNEYEILLTGKMDSLGFDLEDSKIDLGIFCPDETHNNSLRISNTGDITMVFQAKSDNNQLEFTQEYWTISPGVSKDLTYSVSGTDEKSYSAVATIKDTICGSSVEADISWIIETPDLSSDPIMMISKPGEARDSVIAVVNHSGRSVTVEKAEFGDAVFTLSGISLPYEIKSGDTMYLSIRYLPPLEQLTETELILSGIPCSFADTILFTGNPSLSMTDIAVDDIESQIGKTIQIPVYLRNSHRFDESNTSKISFKVKYYADVLEAISPTSTEAVKTTDGDWQILEFSDVDVDPSGADQILTTLNFRILRTDRDNTPIAIEGTQSNGGEVYYNQLGGLLTILKASAVLYIDTNITAKPGEEITVALKIKDAVNVNAFHSKFAVTFNMNKTLLQPIGEMPKGNIKKDSLELHFKDVSLTNPGPDSTVKELKFLAMLGNAESTVITISDAFANNGYIDFTMLSGKITIEICKDGEPRLFDPDGETALLGISPNPAHSTFELKFTSAEKGKTVIRIYDLLGSLKGTIFDKYLDGGEKYDLEIDATELESGTYIILMQTPTRVFSKRFYIVK